MTKKTKQKHLDALLSDLQRGLSDMATWYYLKADYQSRSENLLSKINDYYRKQSKQSKRNNKK